MPESSLIRSFLAADLDDAYARQARRLLNRMPDDDRYNEIRWSKPENLHVSIQFYGNLDRECLTKMTAEMAPIMARSPMFALEPNGLTLFPKPNRPRVLVLTFAASSPLNLLAEQMRQVASKNGVRAEDRPFHAHMTLGRVKKPRPIRMDLELIEDLGPLTVKHITLYRSELAATGPVYSPMHRFELK